MFIGQYQCFAENTWGVATSKSVMVLKAELNLFNNEPNLYIDAQEGEPFKLTCHPPTAWPKPIVNWLKTVKAHNNIILFINCIKYKL